ncbi:dimethyladenosine transferase 2, mitochondrial-like [Glandiceps talaboti]
MKWKSGVEKPLTARNPCETWPRTQFLVQKHRLTQSEHRCMATSSNKKRKTIKKIKYNFEDRENLDTLISKYSLLSTKRKLVKQCYILDREVASTMIDKIWPNGSLVNEKSHILEAFPGPGIVTEELLKRGAPQVVALENHQIFLPFTEELSKLYPGRLQVIYGDVTRLDPIGEGDIILPARPSKELFHSINVKPASWDSEPVIKVFQVLANRSNERRFLLRNVYNLISRYSWFQFGRIETFLILSDKEFKVLTQPPCPVGKPAYYQLLTVLYNMCYEIELLHVEPRTSLYPNLHVYSKQNGEEQPSEDTEIPNVYLVKATPRRDFFSHNLTKLDYDLILFLVKQLLTKRSFKLKETVEKWVPGYGSVVTKYGFNEKTKTGEVTGEQYFKILHDIIQTNGFEGSWLKEEAQYFAETDTSVDNNNWSARSKYMF